jgi:hypothetical protein
MTICITTIGEATGNAKIVKIAGRLQSDDFDELLRVVHHCGDPVSLDLSELQSIDRPSCCCVN